MVELDEYDALDILDRLVVRSMVVATSTELGTRYRQLETLRQYADDRLVERGAAHGPRDRHLVWARALAEEFRLAGFTSGELPAFRRYLAEIHNFHAAVQYTCTLGRLPEACDVISGVGFYALCRPTYEIVDWLDRIRYPSRTMDGGSCVNGRSLGGDGLLRGKPVADGQLLEVVPEAYEHNVWVLTAANYESLFVSADFDQAETRLATVIPTDEQEAVSLSLNWGQAFQTAVYYSDHAVDHT